MKFAIAVVVVLAVAMEAQSSIVAGIPGIDINGLGIGAAGTILAQGPIALGWGVSIPIAAATAANPGQEATYVAKTRGAVHTAPLPGHTQSVTLVNAAPAPGTW